MALPAYYLQTIPLTPTLKFWHCLKTMALQAVTIKAYSTYYNNIGQTTFLLNNDTVVAKDFLTQMITMGNTSPQVAAVVPKIFYFDAPDVLWYAGGYVNRLSCMGEHFGLNQQDGAVYNQPKAISFMNGCSMLIKTDTLEKVGFLDDLFFANCEDTDLSIRIRNAGYQIMYQPLAHVWHKVSYSFKNSNQSAFGFYLATRNLVILQLRYNWGRLIFIPAVIYFLGRWMFYLQLKFILTGKWKNIKALYQGVTDGFTKRLRLQKKRA
jgi:GT2 family glycosyltransferase